MAITRVRAYIDLHALLSLQHVEKEAPGEFAPAEDREKQWVQKHHCHINWVDKNDWDWRWETAIAILCQGYAETTGSYIGDVGGQFL